MLTILQDAIQRPDLFLWFGPIPTAELDAWASGHHLNLLDDLLEFWRTTGGGDVFETETFLRPTVPSVPNTAFHMEGDAVEIRAGLLVFQTGAFVSAIRFADQKYVTLSSGEVEHVYGSFNDWYTQTLRAEFADRYGLK